MKPKSVTATQLATELFKIHSLAEIENDVNPSQVVYREKDVLRLLAKLGYPKPRWEAAKISLQKGTKILDKNKQCKRKPSKKMSEQWLHQKHIIKAPLRRRIYRWFVSVLRRIGIFVSYDCRVLDTPKQVEDGFSYSLMKVAKNYHVFFLKVYTASTRYVAGIGSLRLRESEGREREKQIYT